MGRWISKLFVSSSIPITAAYILRVTRQVFFGEVKDKHFFELPRLTWQEYTAGTILATLIIAVGLFPDLMHPLVDSGVTPVVERLNGARTIVEAAGNPLFGR